MKLDNNELNKLREKISYVHVKGDGYTTGVLIKGQRYYLRASKKIHMFGPDEYYAEMEVDKLDTVNIENAEDIYNFLYQIEGQMRYEHNDKEVGAFVEKVANFKESLK